MENRQPTYPGRVLITPESGEAYYATLTRADKPTVEGTPLNKSTLLQDATCAILDIPDTSVPNDAFVKLALGIGKYGYSIHVQLPDGQPIMGATITGAQTPSGGTPTTDENGNAVIVSTSTTIGISVESPWIDVQNSQQISVVSTGILTQYIVTLQRKNTENGLKIDATGNFLLSTQVKSFDATAIGGGGGGGGGNYQCAGSGGGGGYIQTTVGHQVGTNREISVQIGAGGESATPGGSGGNTVISVNGTAIVTAQGGGNGNNGGSAGDIIPGGAGNGNGGGVPESGAENGGNASGYLFNEPSLGVPGGGGGGAGWYSGRIATGGSPYGGNGGTEGTAAEAGKGPGGGGGGGAHSGSMESGGENGASGAVWFRFHYD